MYYATTYSTTNFDEKTNDKYLYDSLNIQCRIDVAKHLIHRFFALSEQHDDLFLMLQDIGFSITEVTANDSTQLLYHWETEYHRTKLHLSGKMSIRPSKNMAEIELSIEGHSQKNLDTVEAKLAGHIAAFFEKAIFRRLLNMIRNYIEHQEDLVDSTPIRPFPFIKQSNEIPSITKFHHTRRNTEAAYAQ